MLIEALENIYSGYSFSEMVIIWKDVWGDLLGGYDPINELEYQ